MSATSSHEITRLLLEWNDGDQMALDKLVPLVEAELRRLARTYMNRERAGHTLQTTALINEAYVRLIDSHSVQWQSRAHFYGIAAQVMRRILVDCARDVGRTKRGGRALRVSLSDVADIPLKRAADVVALDDALKSLEAFDRRKSRVVELRFFGGLSLEETAEALDVSVATVRRDWSLARAWLHRELGGGPRDRRNSPARHDS